MQIAELYRLARSLRDLALAAVSTDDSPVSIGQMTIVEDIFHYAPTTVAEITMRTSLAQSFVSKTVAEARKAGVITVERSPLDKRKSIISLDPKANSYVRAQSQQSITNALAETLPNTSAKQLGRIEELLQELADILGSK